MVNTEFIAEDIWGRISDLSRASKRRHVAVAYVASDGMKMLRLAKGDVLVVDMSEARVKVGATDPTLIRQYMDKGVTVYSLQRLHAKVFVFDRTAVIGSTNVSRKQGENKGTGSCEEIDSGTTTVTVTNTLMAIHWGNE